MSVSRYGTAFTAAPTGKLQGLSQIAVFLDFETASDGEGALEKIVGYFFSQEEKNFFVGQWKDGIEFNVRTERSPRGVIFGEDGVLSEGKRTTCLVVYDGQKMHFYADGKLVRKDNRGPLLFKNWSKDYPLVVGSDGNGRAQWRGGIYEIAIYDRAVTPGEVQGFKGSRVKGGKEPQATSPKPQGNAGKRQGFRLQDSGFRKETEIIDGRPLVHYVFRPENTYETEFRGRKALGVRDLGKGEPADLVIPEQFEPYKRIYFGWEGDWFKTRLYLEDTIVNVLGFVPFGFLLFVQFVRKVQGFKGSGVQGEDEKKEPRASSLKPQGGNSEIAAHPLDARNDREGKENPPRSPFFKGGGNMTNRKVILAVVLAVVVGFAVSFAIEYLQAYLPSRDSSLRDLCANTVGTLLGAAAAAWYSRKGFGLQASGFGIEE